MLVLLDNLTILFAHENLAFCVRNILWRVRREISAVVTLQPDFPTKLSAPNIHTNRV